MAEKTFKFLRQNLLLLATIFVLALGVSICIRSGLGSSPISVIPFVLSEAGGFDVSFFGHAFTLPKLSIGMYTYGMHIVFVVTQLLVLRRNFNPVQFFQLIIGFVFSAFLDLTMIITAPIHDFLSNSGLVVSFLGLLVGGAIMGFGTAIEVRCKSVLMPGEGIYAAIAQVTKFEFAKIKIAGDVTLVAIGVGLCFWTFGSWQWWIIGLGTLVSMFYVGASMRFFSPHVTWVNAFIRLPEAKEIAKRRYERQNRFLPVITIAREYGAAGHEVGQKVAEALGFTLYDKDIIEKTAQNLGMEATDIVRKEQKITSSQLLKLIMSERGNEPDPAFSKEDAIFMEQTNIIYDIAQKGHAVIIGRLADYVLEGRPNCIRVFLKSSLDVASARIASERKIPVAEARKVVAEVNQDRANHYWRYTEKTWGDPNNYEIVLSTSIAGADAAARSIVAFVNWMQGKKAE